jgi:hypothetical protein
MITTTNHAGGITVSEFVTDGTDTWLETITFYGYRTHEAKAEYSAEIARRGYKVAP